MSTIAPQAEARTKRTKGRKKTSAVPQPEPERAELPSTIAVDRETLLMLMTGWLGDEIEPQGLPIKERVDVHILDLAADELDAIAAWQDAGGTQIRDEHKDDNMHFRLANRLRASARMLEVLTYADRLAARAAKAGAA